jgi:polyisoprenoid-binding protein YceI
MNSSALLLWAAAALAQTERVHLDPAATRVNWTLDSLVHTVHGTFKVKSADLWFDPATAKAGGRIVVDARSGESGSGARDSRMHKNILESQTYPEITFVPDRIEGTVKLDGDSSVGLHGAFTIHGGTHEVTMPVKTHVSEGQLTATLSYGVPYLSWGLKNPSTLFLKVSDTVNLEIHAAGEIHPGQTP